MGGEFVPPSSVCFSIEDIIQGEDDRSEVTGPFFNRGGSISLDGGLKADYFRLMLSSKPDNYRTPTNDLRPTPKDAAAKNEELLQTKLQVEKQEETMSSGFVPPSSVCFSNDDILQEEDDRSELTGPMFCRRGSISLDGGLKADIRLNLAAKPNYCCTSTKESSPTPKYAGDQHEELLQMKMQVVQQKEMIEKLSLKLKKCELDTQALLAERAVLLDEIAQPNQDGPSDVTQKVVASVSKDGGPLQSLLDKNAKLMAKHARLQVAADITRKSLKKYMEDSRETSEKTNERLKTLEQENELLRKRLGIDSSAKDVLSNITSTTKPLDASSRTIPSNEGNSFFSGEEINIYEGHSLSDALISTTSCTGTADISAKQMPIVNEDNEIEDIYNQLFKAVETFKNTYGPRRESDNLLVEFGETEPPKASATVGPPRRWSSLTGGMFARLKSETIQVELITDAARRHSEDLLVGFDEASGERRQSTGMEGETRRATTTARRWHSLKF